MVTVQPLTKKRKISWRLLKIENQLLPPVPFPRARGGRRNFFCGGLQAGYARLQAPLIFSPLPQRRLRRWGRGWQSANLKITCMANATQTPARTFTRSHVTAQAAPAISKFPVYFAVSSVFRFRHGQ